jgi:hypothetical protein
MEETVVKDLREELADRIGISEAILKHNTMTAAEHFVLNNQIATMRALSWLLLMQGKE